jgi:hypothetical protein
MSRKEAKALSFQQRKSKDPEGHITKHAAWRHARRDQDPSLYLLQKARARAKRNSIPFSLTREDIRVPPKCPVLGIPLKFGGPQNPNSPSLDRIRNEEGYHRDNIVVVSYRANILKKDATPEELMALALFYKDR